MHDIEIAAGGFKFSAWSAGDAGAPLVLLLHGFPQTRHTWRHELPALAAAGFRAVAPDQRGYSPGARPDDPGAYRTPALVADVLAIADALGADRFHLVGHDWGGQIAWLVAGGHPERVRGLSVLSRPHPAAFAMALKADPAQAERSKHHRRFLAPETAGLLLEDGARRLRGTLAGGRVPPADIDAYLDVLGDPAALEAALNWYRAPVAEGSGLGLKDAPKIAAPTLYLWGSEDASVGRIAAEATGDFVAGSYRFVEIEGAGHFLTDERGDDIARLIVGFIAGLP